MEKAKKKVNGKAKGSSFERLVAKTILDAFGEGFDQSDCRRVPMSGADKFFDQGDLIISPRLRELFPFCVECKHRKNFRLEHIFKMTKDFEDYHRQVLSACEREKNVRMPMVVIRGQAGAIYASFPVDVAVTFSRLFQKTATKLSYYCQERRWLMSELSTVLSWITNKAAETA